MAELKRTRPFFLNLLRIKFPVGAIASIGHRVSGVVLVLSAPVLIYLFEASLRSAQDYEWVGALLDTVSGRGLALVMFWTFAHHLFAGIRHLLMDVDIGSSLPVARLSAWLVNIAGVSIALIVGGLLL